MNDKYTASMFGFGDTYGKGDRKQQGRERNVRLRRPNRDEARGARRDVSRPVDISMGRTGKLLDRRAGKTSSKRQDQRLRIQ